MDPSIPSMEIESEKLDVDDDGRKCRTGNMWTASAHIITAVIGSGVLSISWALAQMGWIAGPIMLLLFAICTLCTSRLLADCYRSPHPVTGRRNYVYMDAVKANLSKQAYVICGIVQYTNLIGTGIGYTITAATSAKTIQKTNCLQSHTRQDGAELCLSSTTLYIVLYGALQVVLSQIPNFSDLWWLSYVAATMSFTYSLILLALGIDETAKSTAGHDFGSITGVPIGTNHGIDGEVSRALKVWNIFTALGDVAFAFSYSVILLEICDTLKSSPPENRVMKRATLLGMSMTTFFYLTVSVFGYLAFGNSVPGNLLTGFTSPYWLVDFANACVVIHLVGAYQVFSQPIFQIVEMYISSRFPNSTFLNKGYAVKIPFTRISVRINLFRSIWRTAYVIMTTLIAMLLPFFNDIMGILGAFGFWPLTIYFPLAMFIKQFQVPKWSRKWVILQSLSLLTLVISGAALLGSIVGIYLDVKGGIQLFKKD